MPKFFVFTDYHQKKEFIHYIIMHPQHHRPPSTTQKNLKLSPSNHSTPLLHTYTQNIRESIELIPHHAYIHPSSPTQRAHTRGSHLDEISPVYLHHILPPRILTYSKNRTVYRISLSLSLSPMVNGSAQQVEGRRRGVFLKRKKERERERKAPALAYTWTVLPAGVCIERLAARATRARAFSLREDAHAARYTETARSSSACAASRVSFNFTYIYARLIEEFLFFFIHKETIVCCAKYIRIYIYQQGCAAALPTDNIYI